MTWTRGFWEICCTSRNEENLFKNIPINGSKDIDSSKNFISYFSPHTSLKNNPHPGVFWVCKYNCNHRLMQADCDEFKMRLSSLFDQGFPNIQIYSNSFSWCNIRATRQKYFKWKFRIEKLLKVFWRQKIGVVTCFLPHR